ncbi:MAG: GntR family transcriptional regulator [Fusobacterium sp.]|uniref:GntR family transcriptional regulator n=1 Tax=Fusobacterium sp. TaxID=68766 RepID=UPI0029431D46|nr:GntR family transcriptional regulator [Fusobacterium sp.]MDY3059859.1 GntR family transcriptional regulator [Fusobacterium sp.]
MKSLKEKVYEILKEMIISGTLKYNERIEEDLLATSLKVSRTPVREAINKLEQNGWINIIPRRGIFVSNISLKAINDIFKVRLNVEPLILKMGFDNIPLNECEKFKNHFKSFLNKNLNKEDAQILDKLDNDLHFLILKNCNNNFLEKMMENVYEHNMRLRNQSIQSNERRLKATKEHIDLIDALLEKNLDKAIELIKDHNIKAQKDFFNSL